MSLLKITCCHKGTVASVIKPLSAANHPQSSKEILAETCAAYQTCPKCYNRITVSSLCILVTTSWASSRRNKFFFPNPLIMHCFSSIPANEWHRQESRERRKPRRILQNWHKSSVGSQLGSKAKQEVQTLKSSKQSYMNVLLLKMFPI